MKDNEQELLKKLSVPIKPSLRDGARDKISGELQQWEFLQSDDVIDRLNEVFGLKWNFRVVEKMVVGQEIAVITEISYEIDGKLYFKQQGAGKKIDTNLSGAIKSAISLSLVKTAQLMGIQKEPGEITEEQKTEINELLQKHGKKTKSNEELDKISYSNACTIIEKLK